MLGVVGASDFKEGGSLTLQPEAQINRATMQEHTIVKYG